MGTVQLKIAIILAYAVFAVLLNSVGTVILQSIETFHVSKVTASTLEAFKDLSIAAASFLLAASLPRFGFRNAMMMGLAAVALACIAMPLFPGFWTTRLLFFAVGISFAVTKVSVYSFVGLLTDNATAHASLLNIIEGVFMLGVLGGYWLFSGFVDSAHPESLAWLRVYWVLAGLSVAALGLLATSRYDESAAQGNRLDLPVAGDFKNMITLAAKPLTLVFVTSVFLYVLVEQGIGSWLPTFNRQLLHLTAPMSIQAASIFAIGLAAGRLGAGLIVRLTGWYVLVIACLLAMATLMLVALPLAALADDRPIELWSHAPIAAFVVPLIGLFMAPVYPALNSAILSALPRSSQSAMVGLIVVFSALGGTTGSFIVGRTFAAFGGTSAFYLLLGPILGLVVTITMLKRGS